METGQSLVPFNLLCSNVHRLLRQVVRNASSCPAKFFCGADLVLRKLSESFSETQIPPSAPKKSITADSPNLSEYKQYVIQTKWVRIF